MDLINFLRVLIRRKWLLLAIFSVAVITTFLIARQAPEVYRVSAQLASGLTADNNLFYASGRNQSPQRYEIEAKLKNMAELIQSPQVLTLVSYQLILHDIAPNQTSPFRSVNDLRSTYSPTEQEAARKNYQAHLDSMETLTSTNEQDQTQLEIMRSMDYDPDALRRGLNVRRIPGTDLIDLEFTDINPRLAAFVVNTLSQEFIRYYADVRASRMEGAVEFFREMVEEKKGTLDNKIERWEDSQGSAADRSGISPVRNTLVQIERFERARDQAVDQLAAAQRRQAALRQQINDGIASSYVTLEAASPEGRSPELEQALALSLKRYVAQGMNDGVLADSIAALTIAMEDALSAFARNNLPSSALNDFSLVKGRIEAEVQEVVSEITIKTLDIELRHIGGEAGTVSTSDEMETPQGREVEMARDDYLLMLNKLHDARLSASEIGTGNLSQVAFVQAPEAPLPSQTWLLTVLSGMVSLAIGVLVIFVMEYLDTSIKFPSRFNALTGMERLGVLNRLGASNLDLVSLFSETQKNQSLETYKQLLRKIRYELEKMGAKNILLTSTKGGAGKTSMLVSLAYSISLNGKRVLLIDTNFKDNALTKIIGSAPTLEKYLNREIPRRALVSNSVFDGIDVIGCAGGNFSPSEVFKEEAFERLLADLQAEYDVILMEGPALNSFSDSRELAHYADKVIPIFAANMVVNEADKTSIEYLQSLGDQVTGAVLNKVELKNLSL
jgi:Mrp family chromosome partitioning ATPase/uncharacterized protein involved in exopolysaccharide biosynthesis